MAPDEKVCPHCAETIKRAAVKCRYCHSILPAETRRENLSRFVDSVTAAQDGIDKLKAVEAIRWPLRNEIEDLLDETNMLIANTERDGDSTPNPKVALNLARIRELNDELEAIGAAYRAQKATGEHAVEPVSVIPNDSSKTDGTSLGLKLIKLMMRRRD